MEENKNFKTKAKKGFGCLISIALVIAGAIITWWLMHTAPVAKKAPPAPMSASVQVEKLKATHANAKVDAMGTVIAIYQLSLKPKVSGIVKGFGSRYGSGYIVSEGDALIYIEDVDQKAAYALALAEVAKCEANLAVELGYQEVAKRELEILQNDEIGMGVSLATPKETELALRTPQLNIVKAELEQAKANLDIAKSNLDYCTVKAPFNGVIDGNLSAVGMYASPTTTFCDMYCTDYFWVDVIVPYETLELLDIPIWNTDKDLGSLAKVHIRGSENNSKIRDGFVHRMRGKLNSGDSMVRLMILVNDPLSLQAENKDKGKLLLETKVDVEIDGRSLGEVYEIPRSAWRDNSEIWIVDSENKLQKMYPKLLWRNKNTIYISTQGVPEGTRIITSNLTIPIEGLSLKVMNEEK